MASLAFELDRSCLHYNHDLKKESTEEKESALEEVEERGRKQKLRGASYLRWLPPPSCSAVTPEELA